MNIIIYKSISMLFDIIYYILVIRAILSWLPISSQNPIIRGLDGIIEPMLSPIRRLISKSTFGDGLMIDFSFIILFILLQAIEKVILSFVI